MTRRRPAKTLAQAPVTRGGWYDGKWLTVGEAEDAERRWAARSIHGFAATRDVDQTYQCGGCRWFAATGADYGICYQVASPFDGHVVFEHGSCAFHSERPR